MKCNNVVRFFIFVAIPYQQLRHLMIRLLSFVLFPSATIQRSALRFFHLSIILKEASSLREHLFLLFDKSGPLLQLVLV